MSKKSKYDSMAVIDIGSNELRLRIAQNSKGKLKFVETLSYPLSLGRDTFNTGKISFEKVEKTCEIIRNFQQVMREFGVVEYKAVATTAVREAKNRDYILDQIKIKTGLTLNVIDDSQEKLYIYKLMLHLLDENLKQSAMMVYIGSGNIGLSMIEQSKITFVQNIKIGSLRISEIFEDVQEYSTEFYKVVEEYLESFTDVLEGSLPKKIKNFIASGHEISLIADLCKSKKDDFFVSIKKDSFLALYEEIKFKTVERIVIDHDLPFEKAELLLPAISIYKNLLEFTDAKEIITPIVFLSDALLYEMIYPDEFLKINKDFDKNTIICAKLIAKKYLIMEKHYSIVEFFSLKIFDKMKKIHGLGKREKLLLQVSSILHDIGKFVNINNHYRNSYEILKATHIVGLNYTELEIIANISLYHSRIIPSYEDENYKHLSIEAKVLVSKLTAILRIADSLDRSHYQKIQDIDVKITDEELIITIISDKNIDLEEWSFKEKARFFEEVFGLKAIIKKRKVN